MSRRRKETIPVQAHSGKLLYFSRQELRGMMQEGRVVVDCGPNYHHVFATHYRRDQREASGHLLSGVTRFRLNAEPGGDGGGKRTKKPLRAKDSASVEFEKYRQEYVEKMTL